MAVNQNRTVLREAKAATPFYSQNVGYRATLFLPQLWRRFQSWVMAPHALVCCLVCCLAC
jgi:hypothetical protein